MPIGSGTDYETYLNRYTNLFKPAIETFKRDGRQIFKCVRADFISRTGSITRSVLEHLYRADLVLADLTTLNPNVFYELGVRHALRQGTLLVALDGTQLPFDIEDLRFIPYRDRVGAERQLIPKIHEFLDELTAADPIDSPVFAAIPALGDANIRKTAELAAKVSSLEAQLSEARFKLAVADQTNISLRESASVFERAVGRILDKTSPPLHSEVRREVETAVRREQKPTRVVQVDQEDVDPTSVFVLMPFGTPWQNDLYEIIKMAADAVGLNAFRADDIRTTGRIMDEVFGAIRRAGVVIADVTGKNPNVLYEIGIAHTLGKRTILLTQDISDVPFDVAAYRVLTYHFTPRGVEMMRRDLELLLTHGKGAA